MNILAIDSSTKRLGLAVVSAGLITRYRHCGMERPLSSSIMPGIKKILKDAGLSLARLDGLAVGLGPGSFTSLRVGLATVKGLAFATGIPVVGISSLDVLAMNAQEDAARICVMTDARRGMVYACCYEKRGTQLLRLTDYVLAAARDVARGLRGPTVFIGDGALLYREEIERRKSLKPSFTGPEDGFPDARCLARLALARFQSGQTDDIARLVPMYLYPDDCQVKGR